MPEEKACCAKCGFLSVRDDGGNLREVDENARSNWEHLKGGDPTPLCFAMAAELKKEGNPETPFPKRVQQVIEKDRPGCIGKFIKWKLGHTPKEHQEMIDRDLLMKLEDQRRVSDKRWHLGMVLASGLLGLVGVIVGKYLSSTQPPVINNIIQLPEKAVLKPPRTPDTSSATSPP